MSYIKNINIRKNAIIKEKEKRDSYETTWIGRRKIKIEYIKKKQKFIKQSNYL